MVTNPEDIPVQTASAPPPHMRCSFCDSPFTDVTTKASGNVIVSCSSCGKSVSGKLVEIRRVQATVEFDSESLFDAMTKLRGLPIGRMRILNGCVISSEFVVKKEGSY